MLLFLGTLFLRDQYFDDSAGKLKDINTGYCEDVRLRICILKLIISYHRILI
mgnify:CR=1 FL=1